MNKNFADWYRIANIEPSDELLRNRWQGIETYVNDTIEPIDVVELVKLFFCIHNKNEFRDKFTQIFQNIDSAFSYKSDVEISVLAGTALVLITEDYGDLGHLALLAVKAAAFNHRSPIVNDIFEEIQSRYEYKTSEIREKIFDFRQPDIKIPSSTSLIEKCKVAQQSGTWDMRDLANQLSQFALQLDEFFNDSQSHKKKEAERLKIFSEDSQILWWMTGEWSKDFDKPFKEITIAEAAIISGKELSDMIQVIPGPFAAKAVLHKVLSNYSAKNKSMDIKLKDVVDNLEHEWKEALIKKYDANIAKEITPVLFSIAKSLEVDGAGEWLPLFKKNIGYSADETKVKPITLAYQMYLECLFFKCYIDVEG